MTNRLAHGGIALAISLATVGAVVSAEQGEATGVDATAVSATTGLGSEVYVPAPAGRLGVEIRSGRIGADATAVVAMPTSVRVEAIALEAPVIPVGVDENRQLDVPDATTVGWYRHGAAPGEAGASVLAAHVDYGGAPGAFFNLALLKPGDQVQVVLDDGSVLPYEVVAISQYEKTELPAEELFRKDGSPVLQLITCGGTFDPQARSYRANVVVTAVPVTGNGSA